MDFTTLQAMISTAMPDISFNFMKLTPKVIAAMQAKFMATIFILALAMTVRWVVAKSLDKQEDWKEATKLVWRHRSRHFTTILALLAVAIIWAPQLQSFAVSAFAVGAALVLALKELITCFTGAVLRTSTEGKGLGSRIVVADIRGDVVAANWLSTTLLEVDKQGQRTGRIVDLPNSIFLTAPCFNESSAERRYLFTDIVVPCLRDSDWQAIEASLLAAANKVMVDYSKSVKNHFARLSRRFGVLPMLPVPEVRIELVDADKLNVILHLPVPAQDANKIKQLVLRQVLGRYQSPINSI